MKVYRLEKDGLGPFVYRTKSSGHVRKPSIFKKGDNPDNFAYGCSSLEKLEEYFKRFSVYTNGEYGLENFFELGFTIQEYSVPKRAIRAEEDMTELAFPIHYLGREWKNGNDIAYFLSLQRRERQFTDSIDV